MQTIDGAWFESISCEHRDGRLGAVVGRDADDAEIGLAMRDGHRPIVRNQRAEALDRVVEPASTRLGDRWPAHDVTITSPVSESDLSAADRMAI